MSNGQLINIFPVWLTSTNTILILNPEKNKDETGKSYGQANDINNRIELVVDQIPNSRSQVIV